MTKTMDCTFDVSGFRVGPDKISASLIFKMSDVDASEFGDFVNKRGQIEINEADVIPEADDSEGGDDDEPLDDDDD
jgi:hypothetical protein